MGKGLQHKLDRPCGVKARRLAVSGLVLAGLTLLQTSASLADSSRIQETATWQPVTGASYASFGLPRDLAEGLCLPSDNDVAGRFVGALRPGVPLDGAIAIRTTAKPLVTRVDASDRSCIGRSLEFAADRRSISWRNSESGIDYSILPLNTFRGSGGLYCREFRIGMASALRQEIRTATACRYPDRSWRSAG